VQRGHGGHTQIHFTIGEAHSGAPVLRQAPLSDIEPTQELDARNYPGLVGARQRSNVVQHAVQSLPNSQAFGNSFYMQVAGTGAQSIQEYHVDELDYWWLVGQRFQITKGQGSIVVPCRRSWNQRPGGKECRL
jgi:hypothetical protein